MGGSNSKVVIILLAPDGVRLQHLQLLRSDASLQMEWNGMEWNGMEWNGMEWNGMEWK
jgi:hypothetical protein